MLGTDSPSLHSGTLVTPGDSPFGPPNLQDFIAKATDTTTAVTTSKEIGTLPDAVNQTYSPTNFVNSILSIYNKMTGFDLYPNSTCQLNCSGRGECLNGTCFCSVQYEGEGCHEPNIAYFASFSCIFFIIAAISLGQLLVCIRAEYRRLKTPTIRKACSVTTQKMLYFITFVAAAIRGAYFSSPSNAELTLASSFLSSFYPVILSGGSLIVCFWAEAFHLSDIRCEKPRFLGKSFLGFVIFNVITYSLFIAEIFLQRDTTTAEERSFLTHVFNGCYAFLMFVMVVFFLIYGVEVYFKVRGGFLSDRIVVSRVHTRHVRRVNPLYQPGVSSAGTVRADDSLENKCEAEDVLPSSCLSSDYESEESDSEMIACPDHNQQEKGLLEACCDQDYNVEVSNDFKIASENYNVGSDNCTGMESLLGNKQNGVDKSQKGKDEVKNKKKCAKEKSKKKMKGKFTTLSERGIDHSQLSQSRFGLVFQACMLMITVCFLFSDVLGGFWKNRVPLISRNAYDIVFRVVELGVALWFPCVLWNCIAPEQLWILNPRKILKINIDKSVEAAPKPETKEEPSTSPTDTAASNRECWICYETEQGAPEAGPMIEPCLCTGDVAAVHHNCLRTWLMECAQGNNNSQGQLACKVCQADYQLERSPNWWIGQGFTARHWLRTASLITIMCGTIAGSWAVLQMFSDGLVRSITAGTMLLVLYICLRFLGFNTFTAYQRARYSAVKILGRHFNGPPNAPPSTTAAAMPDASSDASGASAANISTHNINTGTDTVVPTVATISGGQITLDISSQVM